MSEQNKIDPFEEAMRIVILENYQEVDVKTSDKLLNVILNSNYSQNLDENKEKFLLDELYNRMNTVSFGQLISVSQTQKAISDEILSQESKLPMQAINHLKSNKEFPNNIPVLLLKNLLKKLEIPFKIAEKSIWRTFEIIKSSQFISSENISLKPTFRRSETTDLKTLINSKSKIDGKELYENEDSLKKYLSKLENLMN